MLGEIPRFATVSCLFRDQFVSELSEEIFEHIPNKALHNRMAEPKMVFMDGAHIKASGNKKFQKKQVVQTAKVYE